MNKLINFFKAKRTEFYTSVAVSILIIISLFYFFASYSTNYFTFGVQDVPMGETNSILVFIAILSALIVNLAAIVLNILHLPKLKVLCKALTIVVTALLAFACIMHLGDRVSAIGNCIIAPWDAGRGGEQAVYLSIGACVCLAVAMLVNIVGSFFRFSKKEKVKDAV